MGVFDFVRDIGAKVGIGKSTAEIKAEEAAEQAKAAAAQRAKQAAQAARVEAIETQAREAAEAAKEEAQKKAAEAARKVKEKAEGEARRAAAQERFAEYHRSIELENYVEGLGLGENIDIRFDDGTAYISGEVEDQATREKIILAVGNAEGVGKVDEELVVVEAAEEAVFHTVVSGDTLWAIAEKVYGDGSRYPEIFEANKPMLKDPDLIYPGQVLRCPK